MYILFHLRTEEIGTDSDVVYEVENDNEDYLDEVANELARDNAEIYGIEADYESGVEDIPYYGTWEKLDGTREEIEEEYGEIMSI